MLIEFNKVKNGSIFKKFFNDFLDEKNNKINNIISFQQTHKNQDSQNIAIIYGPNGTGKTSFIKVLGGEKSTEIEFSIDGKEYKTGKDIFFVINDQNNRNVIKGEERDFFLGDNIRLEFELRDKITDDRRLLIDRVVTILKEKFNISAAKSPLIDMITKQKLKEFIKDCANSKSRGKNFKDDVLVTLLKSLKREDTSDCKQDKLEFVKSDYSSDSSIIRQLESLDKLNIHANSHVHEIEENDVAIDILSRFPKKTCIVCDTTDIDYKALIKTKESNKQATINSLDKNVKKAIEKVIHFSSSYDPFNIKNRLLNSIEKGNTADLVKLCAELAVYKNYYSSSLENAIIDINEDNDLIEHYQKYQSMIKESPDITDDDILYIQNIISSSMEKPLSINRDQNNHLRLTLSEIDFLNKPRDELPLSNGEQNFLSLTFEFLKAKNTSLPIVVIDDPISSFDSIYKNKIAFAIVKILQDKKRIIFSHNIDLIRLLDSQYGGCYNLYLLNNTEGEVNGIIPLEGKEAKILINLKELLDTFRNKVFKHIKEQELFLISMIPFMRGYSSIIGNECLFNSLTKVMHGYMKESVDIANVYSQLFGDHSEYLPTTYKVSVSDIIDKNGELPDILDSSYPLLNRTLKHSFVYLFLRLYVEKVLVDRYNIDTTQPQKLGQIINKSFSEKKDVKSRVFLNSRKTLINEFNHFEGNLSIFQPAIDISDSALEKERKEIY